MKNLIVFCGKSASGKDTYLNLLTQDEYKDLWKKEISPVVSCTTRPKRDNEIDGKDYYFITKEEMLEKLVRDEMYEITEFNNWFYGTPRSSIKEDKINIGIFNPEGIKILSEEYTNDLILESGKLSFKDKIKKICIGDNITELSINSDDAVIIPKMATDKLVS